MPKRLPPGGSKRGVLAKHDLEVSIRIAAGVVPLPPFYLLGAGIYQVCHVSCERRGDQPMLGLAFFFGILFIAEVLLIPVFGVDYRMVRSA